MNEIYWITRLDRIINLFTCIVVISFVIAIIFTFLWFTTIDKKESKVHRVASKVAICAVCMFSLFRVMGIFVPTTNEALAIYGIGGTIDYIKGNDKAKQLPDKVVDALDKYLDTINENEKDN